MVQPRQFKIGLVICTLLGLFDISSFVPVGAEDGPPVPVIVLSFVFGVITLVGLWFAWRGDQRGFVAVGVSRGLSVLLTPIVDDFSEEVLEATAILTVITAIASVSSTPGGGNRRRLPPDGVPRGSPDATLAGTR